MSPGHGFSINCHTTGSCCCCYKDERVLVVMGTGEGTEKKARIWKFQKHINSDRKFSGGPASLQSFQDYCLHSFVIAGTPTVCHFIQNSVEQTPQVIFIWQVRKMRLERWHDFPKGNTGRKWQGQDLNLGLCGSKSCEGDQSFVTSKYAFWDRYWFKAGY